MNGLILLAALAVGDRRARRGRVPADGRRGRRPRAVPARAGGLRLRARAAARRRHLLGRRRPVPVAGRLARPGEQHGPRRILPPDRRPGRPAPAGGDRAAHPGGRLRPLALPGRAAGRAGGRRALRQAPLLRRATAAGRAEAVPLGGHRPVDRRDAPGHLRRPTRRGLARRPARGRPGQARGHGDQPRRDRLVGGGGRRPDPEPGRLPARRRRPRRGSSGRCPRPRSTGRSGSSRAGPRPTSRR